MKREKWTRALSLAMILAVAVTFAGCTRAQQGAGIGAVVGGVGGAIIGHQSGHRTEGALIGAGAGAVGGYLVGNEMDKRKTNKRLEELEKEKNKDDGTTTGSKHVP